MKKKFRSRIVAALVAVTALTCCFVGSTFAKYTSSSSKSAQATVAHWEITNVSENGASTPAVNSFTFTADKLSPSLDGTPNTLTSSSITVTNMSDVDAEIKVGTPAAPEVVYSSNKTAFGYTLVDASTLAEGQTQLNVAEARVFTFTVAVTGATLKTGTTDTYVLAAKTATETKSLNITFTINWNTLDTNADATGNGDGDAIDTYFGMYATTVKTTLPLTATQASTLGD